MDKTRDKYENVCECAETVHAMLDGEVLSVLYDDHVGVEIMRYRNKTDRKYSIVGVEKEEKSRGFIKTLITDQAIYFANKDEKRHEMGDVA